MQSLILNGAAPDTGNYGVTALSHSVILGLGARLPASRLVVIDHQRGRRSGRVSGGGTSVDIDLVGGINSRRLHRPESFWRIRLGARMAGFGSETARAILRSSAFLDISGGDSFTDLYGAFRLETVSRLKEVAIAQGIPLVLLPQTYGPFRDARAHERASRIVQRSTAAWARDQRSFAVLRQMLGSGFDPSRHRLGVDVAFGLPTHEPEAGIAEAALQERRVVGINVSGLIWNDPREAKERYGFKTDYREAVVRILREVLGRTASDVLVVPHVLAGQDAVDSDERASLEAVEAVGEAGRGRLRVVRGLRGPCEAKWIISRCEWFIGTRMHATIAGLSSETPTAAVSYSDKTLGVFETCGQGAHVHDPRVLSTDELVERVVWSFEKREDARRSLAGALPGVLAQARGQLDQIAGVVADAGAGRVAG